MIGELFDIHPTKSYGFTNAVLFETKGVTPVVTNSSTNNGITGYVDLAPTEKGGIITYSDTTTSEAIFYQPDDFIGYSHIQGLYPYSRRWSAKSLIYFVALFRKAAANRFDYANKFNRSVAAQLEVVLPLDSSADIDFDFMESRIRELEESRIRELEAYLIVSGFSDCVLTQSEKAALTSYERNEIEMKSFPIEHLYDKVELKNETFDKRKDTAQVPTEQFSIPLVNAKHGNNGIMFYGRPEIFSTVEMSIDIVQNGAIATGDVYPQPQATGVLWDAYLIKAISHTDTENSLIYMACTIQKTIKLKFNYDKKAVWNRVKCQSISLPVNSDGEIDFELIEILISAIKKRTISSLKDYIDRERKAYLNIIQ